MILLNPPNIPIKIAWVGTILCCLQMDEEVKAHGIYDFPN